MNNPFGNKRQAKLDPWHVTAIRVWVRSEGLGLRVADQVRALEASYPQVKPETIRQLIMNLTWYDPDYDRTAPLPVAPEAQQASWFLWLVMWVWLQRHSHTSLAFMPLLPGVENAQQS